MRIWNYYEAECRDCGLYTRFRVNEAGSRNGKASDLATWLHADREDRERRDCTGSDLTVRMLEQGIRDSEDRTLAQYPEADDHV